MNFWDSNLWSFLLIVSILFAGMILAFIIKRKVPFMRRSLIPASVLGGIIILIFTTVYQLITKDVFFDLSVFSNGTSNGSSTLEAITYHCLGIGFVAMGLRNTDKSKAKVKGSEVINTGVTTVSGYLVQAILGIAITLIATPLVSGLIEGAGAILCFGYGQGTGQALNFGKIYTEHGLLNGDHFGLSLAALGFLSASIGGVIYLNFLRRKGRLDLAKGQAEELSLESIQGSDEMEVTESIDKFTVQVAMVVLTYMAAYGVMVLLGNLVPGLKATVFGFNFLLGTLFGVLVKLLINFLHKKGAMKRVYINNFMLNRIAGIAFDVMIVAGIAAINLELILDYWFILLILGLVGAFATFGYIYLVTKILFKGYRREQFFVMYGMLTGTASTGMILLREIDPKFQTPASDNLVYQNLPAIILGFPMMILANMACESKQKAIITLAICIGYFIALNVFLFRSVIFRKKNKKNNDTPEQNVEAI